MSSGGVLKEFIVLVHVHVGTLVPKVPKGDIVRNIT